MATVVLLGTLDTKGDEYAFVRDRLREAGVDVAARRRGRPRASRGSTPDIDREEVARAARRRPRGRSSAPPTAAQAMDVMGRGAAAVLARLHGEGRVDGVAAVGGSGNSSIAARAMRDLPVGVPEAHRLDRRLGRHPPLRRGRRRHDDLLGRRHLRHQPDLRADPHQRGRRDRRDGDGDASPRRPASGRSSARRCSASPRPASRTRASGWRSSATRCSSSTPPAPAGSPSRRWPPAATSSARSTRRPPSWPTTSSAASCRRGPTACEAVGRAGDPAGRLARRARHGQLRPARHRARALRGPQPLRPQPDDHAHAHDARGDGRARAPDRRASSTAPTGPTVLFVPLQRRLGHRRRRPAVPRRRGRRGAVRRAARGRRPGEGRARTRSTPTSTTRRSPRRWPTACTS